MFQFDQRVRQQIEQFGRKYPDVISHEIKSDMDLANIGPKFFEAIPQSIWLSVDGDDGVTRTLH